MPKKKFIDKKSSVTFKLEHRSQRDPLIANEDAGDRVLVEVEAAGSSKKNSKELEEEHKYGIYYDDDYNYLQHLRDVNETYSLGEELSERFRIHADGSVVAQASAASVNKQTDKRQLQLPSTLFETAGVELETGLLNQAAPSGLRLDYDADVLAALEDDFDFDDPENALDDDFVLFANAGDQLQQPSVDDGAHEQPTDEQRRLMKERLLAYREGGHLEDGVESDDDSESHSSDDDDADVDVANEETRSRFTQYSMTSSMMRRSDGLKFIDRRFERVYQKYDPDQVGELAPLDEEEQPELSGFLEPNSDRIRALVDEYHGDRQKNKQLLSSVLADTDRETFNGETEENADNDDPIEKIFVEDRDANGDRWDCESILTTHSTLYNRPTLIKEEASVRKVRRIPLDKHGMPLDVIGRGLTKRKLDELDEQQAMDTSEPVEGSLASRASTIRPKGESTEDRKRRKQNVRLERKERRMEKKANKVAFREESMKQSRETAGVNRAKGTAMKLL